jgi:hypothetical protein
MLLRNLSQSEGLCNGTRLIITALGDMIIEAQIMTGTHRQKSAHSTDICNIDNYKAALCLRKETVSD